LKKAFRKKIGLSKDNLEKLEEINRIIERYRTQGYRLTLRQLYYQLVSRAIIANRVQEYAKLSSVLVKGRMGGAVDWDAIEDRLRKPKLPYCVTGIKNAIDDTIEQYRLNRMEGQDNYLEIWCEKDAISNILYRITSEFHVRLMVNRGYSSCTAMHDAYNRFRRARIRKQKVKILYLGDHDPSGLDMIRDVEDRQDEFGVNPEVLHIAITREQIDEFNPPPNPAKITDPRADWYISRHGETSWEVDALPPETLHEVLRESIIALLDMDKYRAVIAQEEIDKERLKEFAEDVEDDEDDEDAISN